MKRDKKATKNGDKNYKVTRIVFREEEEEEKKNSSLCTFILFFFPPRFSLAAVISLETRSIGNCTVDLSGIERRKGKERGRENQCG